MKGRWGELRCVGRDGDGYSKHLQISYQASLQAASATKALAHLGSSRAKLAKAPDHSARPRDRDRRDSGLRSVLLVNLTAG